MSTQPINEADVDRRTISGEPLDDPNEGKHWGDPGVTIDMVPPEEHEVYMKQAGPVGKAYRTEWERYQNEERQARGDEPNAVARERTRLEERGEVPPADVPPGPDDPGGAKDMAAAEAEVDDDEDDEDDELEAPEAETGSQTEREKAEASAKRLGLEVRDYGTAGDWRVYDPATGRQVAKSTVLA